jgi:hypothetical protein
MDYYNFEDLVSSLASGFTINENRKYWFVRTVGGTYYSHFLNGGYVAIDYSDISKKFLDELPEKEESALISLKTAYKDRHPNAKNAGKHAAQLYRFYRGIKEGDVVIIPSPDSNELSFGIVKGAMYEQRLISDTDCPFMKRREVIWKEKSSKHKLHPKLQLAISSRHAISDMTDYAQYIDCVLKDFYIKEEETNLILKIQTENDVTLDDFCSICAIQDLIADFCSNKGIAFEKEHLVMKIQMESPRWLKLTGKNFSGLLLFGVFLNGCFGGGLEFKKDAENVKFSISTKGITGAINEYLDREADRKLVESAARAIDSMKIKKPEDIEPFIKLLEERNKIRNKY